MWFIVFKHIAYALFSIILSNFAADFQLPYKLEQTPFTSALGS